MRIDFASAATRSRLVFLVAASASSVPIGCSKDGASVREAPADARIEPETGPVAVELPPCEPTSASLASDVFGRSCWWSTCHGPGTPAWELDLTEESRLLATIGARAGGCAGWLLVSPGKPEESLLYRKLADEEPPCGERMPWGVGVLPGHALECVRAWIESLAPDAADTMSPGGTGG